jgi:hypothetical protein
MKCLGSWLHRYQIKRQYADCVEEICDICKDRKLFRIIQGKVNNYEYLKHHQRQVLLPQHPLYDHEYKNSKYPIWNA